MSLRCASSSISSLSSSHIPFDLLIETNEADLKSCEIARTSWGGRGLLATEHVGFGKRQNETVLRVPLAHALPLAVSADAEETAAELHEAMGVPDKLTQLLRPSSSDATKLGDLEKMALLLHWVTSEAASTPARVAYANSLPTRDELACGVLWTDGEYPELQDDALASEFRDERRRVHDAYQVARDALDDDFALVPSTAESYELAFARAISRTFGALDGALGLMVPVVDMANHAFGPTCNFRVSEKSFELYARRGAREGAELCITYGEDLTNAKLMRAYGFAMSCNPNEVVPVNVGEKLTACEEEEEEEGEILAASVASALGGIPVDEGAAYAVAARRALEASSSSSHVELTSVIAAIEQLDAELTSFATTLEEDDHLLLLSSQSNHISSRSYAALMYRRERKRLLMATRSVLGASANIA